jgi:hypothetical protein
MGNSKIVYGGRALIDLTNDTVTAETLAEGTTAHGADGEPIVGTYAGIDTSDATAEATDIVQGKTAYVNGEKITGNVTEKLPQTGSILSQTLDADNVFKTSSFPTRCEMIATIRSNTFCGTAYYSGAVCTEVSVCAGVY